MEPETKVLICNNCKLIWIAPRKKCDCGCSSLSEPHPSNIMFSQDFLKSCEMYFGGKK